METIDEDDPRSRSRNGSKGPGCTGISQGPIEGLHAGTPCPACNGKAEVSHISDDEMKSIMKSAVDTIYRLLWKRDYDPEESLALGRRFTLHWDDPELKEPVKRGPRPK